MEILVARNAGFCFGVSRAVKLARIAAVETDGPILTLGPLIHNPQVVKQLEDENIIVVNDLSEIPPGSTVIIRSHGIPPVMFKNLKEKGVELIDATCPFVKNAQKKAAQLYDEGYEIVLVGEEKHPEVVGILGNTNDSAIVIKDVSELSRIREMDKKIAVIAQTTQTKENFDEIVENLKKRNSGEVRVENTICNATTERQDSTCEIAENADLMIVIGGKNSANTARFAKLAENVGVTTYYIETFEELPAGCFEGIKKVGVTAGASTPQWIIEEIIEKIKKNGK